MFEEMKTRHLFGLTLLLLIIFGIRAIFLPYTEDFVGAAFSLILYMVAPVIFFRYHFRKQGRSVREVVFTQRSMAWLPWLLGIVGTNLAKVGR